MTRAPFLVPALLRFPGSAARQDSWGRLLKLTAGGADVSTLAALAKGDKVIVTFELGGERLSLSASVHYAYDDGAELRWTDMKERRGLAKVLVDVLSRV